jgi:hypothetical protein
MTWPDHWTWAERPVHRLRVLLLTGYSISDWYCGDYDATVQKADYAAGNPFAQFVFGPGTPLSVQDDPTAMPAANPATYVTPSSPPFVLLHGSADQLASPSQT